MVMKASVDDDDSGWELSMPEKMEKSNTNWVDITQDFEEACRGESDFWIRSSASGRGRMTIVLSKLTSLDEINR
jgi:hypothetical protein